MAEFTGAKLKKAVAAASGEGVGEARGRAAVEWRCALDGFRQKATVRCQAQTEARWGRFKWHRSSTKGCDGQRSPFRWA
jgi:hypothetical protein